MTTTILDISRTIYQRLSIKKYKSLLRTKERTQLILLYMLGHSIIFIIRYAEQTGRQSETIMRYLKPLIENISAIAILITLSTAVFYYQLTVRNKTEISCRIYSGATLKQIRKKYFTECTTILFICLVLAITATLTLKLVVTEQLQYSAISMIYIIAGTTQIRV